MKWIVIWLDHDDWELLHEEFDSEDEAKEAIAEAIAEGEARKSILVYGEVKGES